LNGFAIWAWACDLDLRLECVVDCCLGLGLGLVFFFFLGCYSGGLLVGVWCCWIGLVVQQFWCAHYSLLGSIISDFSFFIMSSNESFGICFTEKIVLLGNSSLNCLL
jgi:hypothetical protein